MNQIRRNYQTKWLLHHLFQVNLHCQRIHHDHIHKRKKRRQSTDNEIISSEQDEQ